jgi:CheY-like chemotaxis protein
MQTTETCLVGLLLELGFLVASAACGHQAIKTARNLTELDLVITNQFMARDDGWSVLEGLSEDWPDVPVFLVSGGPPSPPVSWPVNLQFAAHFLRTLDHDRLLQRIGDTLDLHWIIGRHQDLARSTTTGAGSPQTPPIQQGVRKNSLYPGKPGKPFGKPYFINQDDVCILHVPS